MVLKIYLISILVCLTVHGSVIKIITEENENEEIVLVNSDSTLDDETEKVPTLEKNSPFFRHAKHQNAGFKNRPKRVPDGLQIGRYGTRSGQSHSVGSNTCAANIVCNVSTTFQVHFLRGNTD